MMNWLLFIALLGMQTSTDFKTTLQQSAKEQKQTLLVFSGSDWCRSCIALKQNVLDTEPYQAYAAKHVNTFVADFPRDKSSLSRQQQAENESLADQYNPKGQFPFLILFNKNGQVVRKHAGGFTDFEELKAWAEH